MRCAAALPILAGLLAACGASKPSPGLPRALVAEARPIGAGARFHPRAGGPVLGRCRSRLGPRTAAHVELFAEDRVVLVAGGIGTRPPRRYFSARIAGARCYGDLVTLEPTGVILVTPGRRVTVGDLFRSWGQPLTGSRIASFTAPRGGHVAVFVDGRRRSGSPTAVPLSSHAEIVLEVGPYVPPHSSYTFPQRFP
jgi:hypothetical protein